MRLMLISTSIPMLRLNSEIKLILQYGKLYLEMVQITENMALFEEFRDEIIFLKSEIGCSRKLTEKL